MRLDLGLITGTLVLALAWSTAAHAKKDYLTPGTEKFKFYGGVGLNIYNSNLRLGSKNFPLSPSIDFEDDLDVDNRRPAAFLGGYWRFKPKHRFAFGYTQLRRSGEATVQRDIDLGTNPDGDPVIVQAGASLSTDLDIDLYTLDYLYSFFNRKDFELAASAGLFWTTFDFRLAAAGNVQLGVPGTPTERIEGEYTTSLKAQAPLPAIGLQGRYFIKPNWSLGAFGKFFYLELEGGDFQGSLVNVGFNTEYFFTRNVGIGGAFTTFRVDAEAKDSDAKVELEYQYSGPQIYLIGKF